jgi:hypothetical protein
MKPMWTLKNGAGTTECTSFPFAFRNAFNLIRKQLDAGKPTADLMKNLTIVGPPNPRGERTKYSYASALDMAQSMGLVTPEGQINSREFKRKF